MCVYGTFQVQHLSNKVWSSVPICTIQHGAVPASVSCKFAFRYHDTYCTPLQYSYEGPSKFYNLAYDLQIDRGVRSETSTVKYTVIVEIFVVVNDSWLKETAEIKHLKI